LGDAGGQNYDLLLDYIQADSGAAFFAPSITFLEDMAGL
jgi:putative iron-dependent peroxidase